MATQTGMAIVCILAALFITVAPEWQQDAYGGADAYEYDAIEIRSFATGEVIDYDIQQGGGAVHTSHYGHYHDPGSSTAAWEHYQNWPDGHGGTVTLNIIGTRWI